MFRSLFSHKSNNKEREIQIDKSIKNENTIEHTHTKKLAGGHKKNFKFSRSGKYVLKNSNLREADFYKHNIKEKTDVLSIVPKTYETKRNTVESPSILMENLLHKMEKPQIIDLKIGFRTTCRRDQEKQGDPKIVAFVKKEHSKVKDFCTFTRFRGWRVVGGTNISGNKWVKAYNSFSNLKKFLGNDNLSQEKIREIYTGMKNVKDVANRSDYAFIDSSVFIAADKDNLKVCLVDFARAITKDVDKSKNNRMYNKYKRRFDKGINELMKEVKKYIK